MIRRSVSSRHLQAQQLRREATAAERKAWDILRDRRLFGLKFRRQHPIGHAVILDFYCPKLKLAIELDGPPHDDPNQVERDLARTRALSGYGVRVVRLANESVTEAALRRLVAPFLR